MKRNTLLTAALFGGSLLSVQAAEPKDEVQNAIKKLTEKANYSWTSTTTRPERPATDGAANNRFRGGPTKGKTANGLVLLSMTRGDRTTESLRKGDQVAVKRDEGWTVVEPRAAGDAGAGDQGQRRGGGRGGFGRNFTAPDAQASELLTSVAELKKEGDVYEGPLTEESAKSLLSFGGGRRGGAENADRPVPTGVKASAKFWIKDGVLAKYETSVAGKMTFNGTERDLGRTTTVELSEVGETKIDAPEDIVKKLESK